MNYNCHRRDFLAGGVVASATLGVAPLTFAQADDIGKLVERIGSGEAKMSEFYQVYEAHTNRIDRMVPAFDAIVASDHYRYFRQDAHADCLHARATVNYQDGNYEEAEVDIKKAIEIKSKKVGQSDTDTERLGAFNLTGAEISMAQAKYDEARTYMTSARENLGEDISPRLSARLNGIEGEIKYRFGDFGAALQCANAAIGAVHQLYPKEKRNTKEYVSAVAPAAVIKGEVQTMLSRKCDDDNYKGASQILGAISTMMGKQAGGKLSALPEEYVGLYARTCTAIARLKLAKSPLEVNGMADRAIGLAERNGQSDMQDIIVEANILKGMASCSRQGGATKALESIETAFTKIQEKYGQREPTEGMGFSLSAEALYAKARALLSQHKTRDKGIEQLRDVISRLDTRLSTVQATENGENQQNYLGYGRDAHTLWEARMAFLNIVDRQYSTKYVSVKNFRSRGDPEAAREMIGAYCEAMGVNESDAPEEMMKYAKSLHGGPEKDFRTSLPGKILSRIQTLKTGLAEAEAKEDKRNSRK